MTRRTSTMMRIPNALVPAVRAMTGAWHAREREKKGYDGQRETLRISDRENVYLSGTPCTAFKVHQWSDEARAYVFAGQFTAIGHDASEEQCRQAASIALAEQDDGSDGND